MRSGWGSMRRSRGFFRCNGRDVLGVDNNSISQSGLTGHGGRPPVGREKLNSGYTIIPNTGIVVLLWFSVRMLHAKWPMAASRAVMLGGRGGGGRVLFSVAVPASRRPGDCFESQETVAIYRECRRLRCMSSVFNPLPLFCLDTTDRLMIWILNLGQSGKSVLTNRPIIQSSYVPCDVSPWSRVYGSAILHSGVVDLYLARSHATK